ncbi:putative ABC transport system permease protein [Brevibacterium sanguinis]|uniref:ABC transport system permease protein n=2 Tax=Brevibacterium TaxID=1696 RepID=A0ABX9GXG9_9MICO|nr:MULTISPECIES: FtsX-like permease family protein [Brevibacterium]RBP68221.1 putative ABC transport system permease protein [Brevibacterium sanguinis]RBP74362.1 putative ABC transport system permease protein [Brevibacterium celere]
MNPLREIRANPRQFAPSVLVVFIAALFGTAIMQGIGILGALMRSAEVVSASDTATVMITIVGMTFFLIALFVSGIVIANTFSIIIAGRSRQLALLRLIGASTRRLRRAAGLEGLIVSVPATAAAVAVSTGLALVTLALLGDAVTVDPGLGGIEMFVPAVTTIAVTWYAAFLGAKRISGISPIEATSQSVEQRTDDVRSSKRSLGIALVLLALGLIMLAGGAYLGFALSNPAGLLIATPGGACSFLGLIVGSAWFLPPLQSRAGRLMGRSASARLAAKNIDRHPIRSSRTVIGLIIGITLVTMFATAMTTFRDQMVIYAQSLGEEGMEIVEDALLQVIDRTMLFFLGMVAFSVVIAVIGVVNALALSVRQRTREIGLLMALGQSPARVRTMVLGEGLQLTVVACLVAVPLGVLYGWIGALAVISPLTGFFAPSLPWWVLVVVVPGSLLAVALAGRVPARAATSINPVEALEAV